MWRWISLALLMLAGCSSADGLARVAKDWSLALRASQVLAVYPLTEDLQPGDVFVVDVPIEREAAEYRASGFLPLDDHVTRIQPDGYARFYDSASPRGWRFATTQSGGGESAASGSRTDPWANAPRAAFATYSFHVSDEAGVELAMPVQGVPIGLSILGAHAAHGVVTITDARTYGIDRVSLEGQVADWAAAHRALLAECSPVPKAMKKPWFGRSAATRPAYIYHYLRVVSRVYLAGKVDVSIFDDDSGGATAQVQTPSGAIATLIADSAGDERQTVRALNDGLASAATQPSGDTIESVKVLAASDRAVSLSENFPQPLVIGYLAFDFRIGLGGRLDGPVSTWKRLSTDSARNWPTLYSPDAKTEALRSWLKITGNREKLRAWLIARGMDADLLPNVVSTQAYAAVRAQIISELVH